MRQYICQKMNHSLSNPNHLRCYEVQVEKKHAILVRKVDMDGEFDLVANFKSQGIIIYIDTWIFTNDDLEATWELNLKWIPCVWRCSNKKCEQIWRTLVWAGHFEAKVRKMEFRTRSLGHFKILSFLTFYNNLKIKIILNQNIALQSTILQP